MSPLGPGCVKTCTRGECAELFSLFSPFDGACQSGSFLIQRNRNKRSTRKFEVGVFTQPGPKAEVMQCPLLESLGGKAILEPGGEPGKATRNGALHPSPHNRTLIKLIPRTAQRALDQPGD